MKRLYQLRVVLAALLVLGMGGCFSVGPDYVRPDISVAPQWRTTLPESGKTAEKGEKDLTLWWTLFNDPQLNALIERAVRGNVDLKKAQARIREARAGRDKARAGYFPTLNATGSATWSRSGQETGSGIAGDLYSAGFDAAWELDVFGGVRRSVEVAQATLEASEESRRDVLVSLLSETAANYVEVRIYQARLASAEANLTSQEQTHQLTVWRNEAGLSDALAVEQSRMNLETTRSTIPALRTGLEEATNRIAVLLGEQPGGVHEELAGQKPIPSVPHSIVVGVPVDVLRRRPDVREAERNLAAQTAQVGVATADLYPKFKISGTLSFDAFSAGRLFSSGSLGHSIGPSISIPIFAGGSIRKNIEAQSALQEQYLRAYETAVLTALEEVENALVAFGQEQKRKAALAQAAQAAEQAADLARIKYEAGLTDFTTVLDAERSLLSAQDELVQSEGQVDTNLIRLYKALGGGWSVAEKEESSTGK